MIRICLSAVMLVMLLASIAAAQDARLSGVIIELTRPGGEYGGAGANRWRWRSAP